MAKNNIITVFCFGNEIGRLGFDENKNKSFFQYNAEFLKNEKYSELFPATGIIKRVAQTQVFSRFAGETFRGLPPMIADSLPDVFGNIIFKKWLAYTNRNFEQISVLEQLTYVANRGMGALEYKPSKEMPSTATIDISEITEVLKQVLQNKTQTNAASLTNEALLNIFKIGTSAGGVRPKILVSENRQTGSITPGDLNYSSEYNHYLVKLSIDTELGYNRETIEFCYYQTATHLGISMMPSKLIEQKHFATLRFDRQNGLKKHVFTASGLTGWDFKSPKDSSYENLFELALFLKVPQSEIEELFRRMVFNVIFCNTDDHLKNHSFIYNEDANKWGLAPAYDLTYALNPLINYKRVSRALAINDKRVGINFEDIQKIADLYTIKNATSIVLETQNAIEFWVEKCTAIGLPAELIQSIKKDFVRLLI